MSASDVLFLLSAATAIGAALIAVTEKRLLYAVLAFGVFLLAVAATFLIAGAQFIAVSQIFIYVGGVVVLLLFGVMLTASRGASRVVETDHTLWAMAAAVALAGVIIGAAVIWRPVAGPAVPVDDVSTLGKALVGAQVAGFEIVGLILLAAVVAALAIVKREEGR